MRLLPRFAAASLVALLWTSCGIPLAAQDLLETLDLEAPARLEVETPTGVRPLAGALVEAGVRTIRLRVTVPEVTIVSATLTPIPPPGGDDPLATDSPIELVVRPGGIGMGTPIDTTLELGLGSYVITLVTRNAAGDTRTFDGGFLTVPTGGATLFSGIRRPFRSTDESDDEPALRYEASTLLVSFDRGVDLETVSASLSAMAMAPEDWFRELALVRVRVPAGGDPFALPDARFTRAGDASPAIAPNLVLEDDATIGERLPPRLASAYQARGRADCSRAGAARRGCFDRGTDVEDPLPAFRYHFFYDTFAGHRLVEHLLRNVATPRRMGIAIVDGGFGDGKKNPSNLLPADFIDFSTPPYFMMGNGRLTRRIGARGRQECRPTARAALAPCNFGLATVPDTVRSHGTKVAIAAAGRGTPYPQGRDKALLGTGPRARLRILKRARGVKERLETALDSIVPIYAAAIDPEVQVINTSFGVNVRKPLSRQNTRYSFGDLMFNLVDVVREQGKIWVTSAGNRKKSEKRCTDPTRNAIPCGRRHKAHFPSDLAPGPGPRGPMDPTILSVGNSETVEALTGPEGLVTGSYYGPRISVVAGGGDLITLDQTGKLVRSTGTSFSAPTVAGLAADMLHLNRNLPPARALSALQIIEMIEATADDLGATRSMPTFANDQPANGRDLAFGHGRINVWKALLAVANGGIDRRRSAVGAGGFPSLASVAVTGDTWFGFSVQSPVHDTTLWLDGQPIQDPQAVRPTGDAPSRMLTSYKGVESTRVIQRGIDPDGDGVPDEDPTSGIVPVGTVAGEYITTFSVPRRDLTCADNAGNGRPCTLSLRRPGETADDLPFFNLRLELEMMRDGQVPGVVYDDFVFEITATDFGDAPANYPTRLSGNGARSLNASLEWLGSHPRAGVAAALAIGAIAPDGVSFEPNADIEAGGPDARVDPDGMTNLAGQNGRDGKDSGVLFFPRTYVPGGSGQVEFTICVAQVDARYANTDDRSLWVNGWIDWNTDKVFAETGGEHVVDGVSVLPGVVWRARDKRGGPISQTGNCATFRRSVSVPATIGPGALWARFRVDYGENVGRNDPRPGRDASRRDWRSDPSLRVPEQSPRATTTGGPGLATGATRFGEVEDYLIGTDYGDAQDRLPDDRDAISPDYATRHVSMGAYSLAIGREWLGAKADTPPVSREIDACDKPMDPADQDVAREEGTLNLGMDCDDRNQDAGDLGVSLPLAVSPGEQINFSITVSSQIDLRGFRNRGPEGPGGQAGGDSAGVQTLKPTCLPGPISDRPDTPERFRTLGRYAAFGTGRERLFLSAWADWNADGDWDDVGETILGGLPVDPEDFGPDGAYTLGEPFDDTNGDGVFTDGIDSFVPARHDVAGLPSRTFQCNTRVPANVALGKDYFWRVRLSYGEGPGAIAGAARAGVVHHADLPAGQARNLAGPRGGNFWGEVEDHPQKAACVETDRCDDSRLELRLRMLDGGLETLVLEGSTTWQVKVCDLLDEDGDGFEEVFVQIADWQMEGWSERWGKLSATLAPIGGNGIGVIEERTNLSPGILDLPPFGETGTAMGRFDVAFDLRLGDQRFRVPMVSIEEEITFKAPLQPEELFINRELDRPASGLTSGTIERVPLMLRDETGRPTDIEVLGVAYAPAGSSAPDS